MLPAKLLRPWSAAIFACALLGGAIVYDWTQPDPGDPQLNAFVFFRPPVPIVFTSRSEPASLTPAAPNEEGFTDSGRGLWAAREGRLRLLATNGTVRELTWGKPLHEGGTLIDVMSPSVSIDGKRILFAGRKAEGHGRFHLYEIGIDGRGLRQLTGGADDAGCTASPPMRWRSDGSLIPEAERRAVDYDDVDPIELNLPDRRILFVSSRTPDLGRDHTRRSTTLWMLHADGRKHPASGNRNNDRWPFLLNSGYIAFSLWSRNREVIAMDLSEIRPFEVGTASATQPTDSWLGAFTQIPGGHFGMLIKPTLPVWRPRPLFVNRIAFMTNLAPVSGDENPPLTVVQAEPGMIAHAPSAQRPDRPLPVAQAIGVRRGPDRDLDGRPLWLATPSPCPPSHVLLAGAPLTSGEKKPQAGAFGLYLARDDWPECDAPVSAKQIDLKRLFDDPAFVDAEPVAIYERGVPMQSPGTVSVAGTPPAGLPLLTGEVYRGSMGQLFATGIDLPTTMGDLPGQRTDVGEAPIFDSPPAGRIDHLRIYAARRDRFDDPVEPRIPGKWESILKVPVKNGAAATWIPTDAPTVLAGFDRDGRVVQWNTAASDSRAHRGTFYAYAGDHYSLAQPGGKHFCVGCHPGHSGLPPVSHVHAERLK